MSTTLQHLLPGHSIHISQISLDRTGERASQVKIPSQILEVSPKFFVLSFKIFHVPRVRVWFFTIYEQLLDVKRQKVYSPIPVAIAALWRDPSLKSFPCMKSRRISPQRFLVFTSMSWTYFTKQRKSAGISPWYLLGHTHCRSDEANVEILIVRRHPN